jgi:hypothetical protein
MMKKSSKPSSHNDDESILQIACLARREGKEASSGERSFSIILKQRDRENMLKLLLFFFL